MGGYIFLLSKLTTAVASIQPHQQVTTLSALKTFINIKMTDQRTKPTITLRFVTPVISLNLVIVSKHICYIGGKINIYV